MNRSAYFTTGMAIRALANFSKADVVLHGEEKIPEGPTIFVINHFTRIETILIPYYIYNLTDIPVFSLASHELFIGGLIRFFDLIGVISTRDPNRDKIIIKGLLTGSENWIIFPEGRMVKTKKIMGKGEFLVSHSGGVHKPHTGAASLAMRAEFFRQHLLNNEKSDPEAVASFLQFFDIASIEEIRGKATSIVPVNLTYYPIRAKENVISNMAAKMVRELPEQMVEEIMTEGTMLLSGVDLDIHFGKPITMDRFIHSNVVQEELLTPIKEGPDFLSTELSDHMRHESIVVMEQYMRAIYDMTTINHEHLFASFMRLSPYRRIKEMGLRRKVFLASLKIGNREQMGCNLHKSLTDEQIHLLTDDRFKKVENFVELAIEKGVLNRESGYLRKIGAKISDMLQFHRGRIDNPIMVMANEVEPLQKLQKLIVSLAFEPDFLIKLRVVNAILRQEQSRYESDCRSCTNLEKMSGKPFLLQGSTKKIGVVLVHSYLAIPEEVKELAEYLNRQGLWVYAPRLAGHGTSVQDLASRSFNEWQLAVERGYALMNTLCKRVVLGGVSVGGCLALELASRNLPQLSAVFAICPPLRLKDYSTTFMPGIDVWDRILFRLKRNGVDHDFFPFEAENPYINYNKNPVTGVREIGRFLDLLKPALASIDAPSLIVHAAGDPVVRDKGAKRIYEEIGAQNKEFVVLNFNNHIIINGDNAPRVHRLIGDFIRNTAGK